MTLGVSNGVLTLAGTAGLAFVGGANGTASMTVTGTVANINAALDGLAFMPTADYSGPAFLSLSVNDLGNSGLGGPLTDADFSTITVTGANDAPAGADATVNMLPSTAYTLTAANFGFTDPDAGDSLNGGADRRAAGRGLAHAVGQRRRRRTGDRDRRHQRGQSRLHAGAGRFGRSLRELHV